MIYLFVLLSLVAAQSVTFFVAKALKNPGVVDFTWVLSLTFFPLCLIWGRQQQTDPYLAIALTILIVLWGTRLGGHIFFSRILPGHVDKRYLDIFPKKSSWDWFYFTQFQFQALLISIILIPFYQLPEEVHLRSTFLLGGILSVLGLNIEMIADQQLADFKKKNNKDVCQSGLWAYSRHPNYFGEFLFWLGIAVCCYQEMNDYLVFYSPLCLLCIFYFLTGPVTEQGSLQRRGFMYAQYQRTVPFMFPKNIRFWMELLVFKKTRETLLK